MIRLLSSPRFRFLAGWLAGGSCLAVMALSWFGYRATREWRLASTQLYERRAEQTADLLVTALARDMRGVQTSILTRLHWDQVSLSAPYEFGDLVASAFARYPYPETFFGWEAGTPFDAATFFTRDRRRPGWLPSPDAVAVFPVTADRAPEVSRLLVERIVEDSAQGRAFSTFDMQLGDEVYQVVARLLYRGVSHDRLERIFGFAVNLAWVRQASFQELTDQVARIGGSAGEFSLAIVDARGVVVAGAVDAIGQGPIVTRRVRPLFFDPAIVAMDPPLDLSPDVWTVRVSAAGDSTLAYAVLGADRSLMVTAIAAIVLGFSLWLTTLAVRASVDLATVRSDFVSLVTHEIKTPLATIRAIGDTLVRGRVSAPDTVNEYALLLDQEAKRLGRLVDNLLAYSRVTDVSDVYVFDAVAPADLVDDVLRGVHRQILDLGVEVVVELPVDLPAMRGDRTALHLVLDNLVDNALRYGGGGRWLGIRAWVADAIVHLEVRDRGVGIGADELALVTRRFVRGKRAASSGSGLGLALARRVIRDHGGTLQIRSELGEGTVVELALPQWDRGSDA